MATSVTIFNEATLNTRTITVDMKVSVLDDEMDGATDYFLILTTNAKKISGAAIPNHTINALTDLARGTTQQDGHTTDPYTSMTAAIRDHLWNMIDGTGGSDAMSFIL